MGRSRRESDQPNRVLIILLAIVSVLSVFRAFVIWFETPIEPGDSWFRRAFPYIAVLLLCIVAILGMLASRYRKRVQRIPDELIGGIVAVSPIMIHSAKRIFGEAAIPNVRHNFVLIWGQDGVKLADVADPTFRPLERKYGSTMRAMAYTFEDEKAVSGPIRLIIDGDRLKVPIYLFQHESEVPVPWRIRDQKRILNVVNYGD
jgi:hypothetical protein